MNLLNVDKKKNFSYNNYFTPFSNFVIIKNKNSSILSMVSTKNRKVFLKVHLKLSVAMGKDSFLMNSIDFTKILTWKFQLSNLNCHGEKEFVKDTDTLTDMILKKRDNI